MATTNLIPVHTGKDGSIIKTLRRVIGYVENPDKTEKGNLITCYQCDPRTAAEEFTLDRRKYAVRSGRGLHRNDVAAYHMRQSFKPGEITPEEANRLGNELAMRREAKKAFDALGLKKLPSIKSLSAEYAAQGYESHPPWGEWTEIPKVN